MRSAEDRLMARLSEGADTVLLPDLLQPADIFVDLAGEEFRKRLFTTEGANGERLCLRPDFTIPVCLEHLARGGSAPAIYAYRGKIFRKRRAFGRPEFEQAGTEWLGHPDEMETDAALYALAAAAADEVGLEPAVRVGDANLFAALLAALDLPPVWRARLMAAYGDPVRMGNALARLAAPGRNDGIAARLAPALARVEASEARAIVEAVVGAPERLVAGRTAADIADRILADAAGQHDPAVTDLIAGYLAIAAPLEAAADRIFAFCRAERIALGAALDAFARRTEALARHGITTRDITFEASFGRRLGYYTGFVFEMVRPETPGAEVIAGGRYDKLIALLEPSATIPAIGFSVWLDRLPEAPC